jgi:hypothetical protein
MWPSLLGSPRLSATMAPACAGVVDRASDRRRVLWMAPLGSIILIAIVSIFFASHPTFAFVVGGMIVLLIVFALRERWHGRPF